jgi:hypothetical protein
VPWFEVHTTEIVTRVWSVDAPNEGAAVQRVVHREVENLAPPVEGRSRLLSVGVDAPEDPADWRIGREPRLDR